MLPHSPSPSVAILRDLGDPRTTGPLSRSDLSRGSLGPPDHTGAPLRAPQAVLTSATLATVEVPRGGALWPPGLAQARPSPGSALRSLTCPSSSPPNALSLSGSVSSSEPQACEDWPHHQVADYPLPPAHPQTNSSPPAPFLLPLQPISHLKPRCDSGCSPMGPAGGAAVLPVPDLGTTPTLPRPPTRGPSLPGVLLPQICTAMFPLLSRSNEGAQESSQTLKGNPVTPPPAHWKSP